MAPEKYPPYLYLCQVADHCPKAIATYLLLWREKDFDCSVIFEKKSVPDEYLITLTKLKNDLRQLCREGLAFIDETPKNITVTLADCELDFEDRAC